MPKLMTDDFTMMVINRVAMAIGGLVVLLLTGAPLAQAATGPWVSAEAAKLRLLSASDAVGEATELRLGLEFELQPGWKIYWRTPGDAGLPPTPDWSASNNVKSVEMDWPVPSRFEIFGIGTLGYEDSVVFPITVTPSDPGKPVDLAGSVDYLVCSDICVPGHAELSLSLPEGGMDLSEAANLIDQFRAQVPIKGSAQASMIIDQAAIHTRPDETVELALAVHAQGGSALKAPDAFIEGPGGAYFDPPTATAGGNGETVLRFTVPPQITLAALSDTPVTVTLTDQGRAVETQVTPIQGQINAAAAPGKPERPLLVILGLALIGGLILNLMPCVLPVLSLKLMSVMRKSGKELKTVRAGFLASAAGIVTSFLLLAGAAIALKLTGMQVGWGIQFQQPVFLALMVALLTLFACNMVGIFEFHLPSVIGSRAAAAGRDPAGSSAGHHSLFGDFLTGAFATLLATPCSAPFLGTAVGFALSAGPLEILAVFLALGLGLALPYLLIALFPSAVKVLPKPGRWMLSLKTILAIALAGTAIWLLSVMAALVGIEDAVSVGALAGVAAAVLATRKLPGSRLARFAWPVSAVLAVAVVLAPLGFSEKAASFAKSDAAVIQWQAFDESAIPGLVADGKTVLVDVTADWCVTCQWNKSTVLESGPVAAWLNEESVVAMKADWTRPDPVIADYLARFGRYGIPFNIVYGPDAPTGVTLPELLSEADVLAAAHEANNAAPVALSN